MEGNYYAEDEEKGCHNGDSGKNDVINKHGDHTGDDRQQRASNAHFSRRSILKSGTAAAGIVGLTGFSVSASGSIDKSSKGKYKVWKVTGKEVYDLSDGEKLSNILVNQTAEGACLTIRSQNKKGWTVRNVGFLGVGQDGEGSNSFQLQVSTPSGGRGLVENIWANGKARNGQSASRLGGIYIRSSHAGHIDIKHTYIEGFGNNAVYGSSVGKDGGNDGSVTLENCYHRDNTVSQFRIGSPGSVVRNCVGIVNDPDGNRGQYPGSSSQNARGIWGKHFRNQRVENSSFYVSPDDINSDGVFEARYISGRSHGEKAVVETINCNANADAPKLTGSTSNGTVNNTGLGKSPTVTVIKDGGVPLSPKMAASGKRSMPPELPGADSVSSSNSNANDSTDKRRQAPRDDSRSKSKDSGQSETDSVSSSNGGSNDSQSEDSEFVWGKEC